MHFRHTALLLSATLVMGGCAATQMTPAEAELVQTLGAEQFQPSTREMRDNIETQPLLAQATFWQREYQLNPGDLESAIKLASAVRRMGSPERAVEITQTTRALYPKDPYLIAEYAAALVSSERGATALPVLETALRTTPGYARLWSLRGAALDQAERYPDARKSYERALSITPYDPNVLANMGLSFALEGDAATAEQWLVQAASIPGASESVARNLELVRELQGRTTAPRERTAAAASVPAMPSAMAAPASASPGRTFRVFNEGEAQSAADVARQMARQGGRTVTQPVLQATDPNALGRLARNASPAGRAVRGAASQTSVQGQAKPVQPARKRLAQKRLAQGQVAQGHQRMQQPTPAQPRQHMPQQGSPFAGPRPQAVPHLQPRPGYPAAYPQGATPYSQVNPGASPVPRGHVPRGRARGR